MTESSFLPLLDALRADPLVQPFLKAACAEHGVSATLSPELRADQVVIISPDGYYNSLNIEHRPKSPDCLVVVQCADGAYTVYLVELRDIKSPKGFKGEEIRAKFATCLSDFMTGVLGAHFNRADISLRRVRLLFVADPNNRRTATGNAHQNQTSRFDFLLTQPPFHYDGRRLLIEPHQFDPLIAPC